MSLAEIRPLCTVTALLLPPPIVRTHTHETGEPRGGASAAGGELEAPCQTRLDMHRGARGADGLETPPLAPSRDGDVASTSMGVRKRKGHRGNRCLGKTDAATLRHHPLRRRRAVVNPFRPKRSSSPSTAAAPSRSSSIARHSPSSPSAAAAPSGLPAWPTQLSRLPNGRRTRTIQSLRLRISFDPYRT